MQNNVSKDKDKSEEIPFRRLRQEIMKSRQVKAIQQSVRLSLNHQKNKKIKQSAGKTIIKDMGQLSRKTIKIYQLIYHAEDQ